MKLPALTDISRKSSRASRGSTSKTERVNGEYLKAKKAEKKSFYMRNFTDIHGHPGLLTANVGSHVAMITLKERDINVELLHDNRPILDLVGTRHSFRNEDGSASQTSLLAVAEDGALRGWTLNNLKSSETDVWKNVFEANRFESKSAQKIKISGVEYPIDFFESCDALNVNDYEYTSPQLQRIYNRQQLKQRLAPSSNSRYGHNIPNHKDATAHS